MEFELQDRYVLLKSWTGKECRASRYLTLEEGRTEYRRLVALGWRPW